MKKMDDIGKIIIVSVKEGFLTKGLQTKIKEKGLDTQFVHAKIKEIETVYEDAELFVILMNDDIEVMTESLVYIKDILQDCDKKVIVIGEQDQYQEFKKIIQETMILEWFKRPMDMNAFLKCLQNYVKNNTGDNKKKSVLIVDDDIAYVRLVYEWLKNKYHVGMATSGVQAISWLARNKADLVLMDYEMPVVNGPQVYEMLKSDTETDSIPVIFLTGKGDKESVMSVVNLNPVDYLLKTIDREELLEKLDIFFKTR